MDEGLQSLRPLVVQAAHELWKRRWLAVGVAWAVAAVAAIVVPLVPNRYEASAQIYVDTQTVLKPLMQGLAYIPDIDQQVHMLARTLVSRPNVERLVDETELGLVNGPSQVERERAIAKLSEQIKIAPVGGTVNLYAIIYRDSDSARAKRLVEATLALFVNASSVGTKRDSQEASQFIDDQIKSYESKLVEAENRLKEFKVRHFGSSGVATQDFFGRMSALSDEVGRLRLDLAAAEQSREAYRRELASENPQLPGEAGIGPVPAAVSELDARIETQKKLLDEMLRRYTEAHPDVVSTRRVITQLEQQRVRENAAKAAAIAAGKGRLVAATSPVYQKLRVSLAETEAQVASLRSQLAFKQARLEEARAMASRMPQVEAELAQLNRDYDIMNKNYQGLVSRRESASLGLKLDETSRLAEFRIVEPPRVSPRAVFPSRTHMALMAIVLALALGIGAPLAIDYIRPTFKSTSALQRATGRQVLGAVTLASIDGAQASLRGQVVGVSLACVGLLVVQAAWVVWLSGRMNIG
jgi:polysaccharide chain length determinant protein (PEP-CTERM system associated)